MGHEGKMKLTQISFDLCGRVLQSQPRNCIGVIPAQAGIQLDLLVLKKGKMDSCFRGNDVL
jgi:hypothetical protein